MASLYVDKTMSYGSNLLTVLDNFFGCEMTAENLFRVLEEHDGTDFAFWEDFWEAVKPLADLTAKPDPDVMDVFSVHPHWMKAIKYPFDMNLEDCRQSVNIMKSYLLYYPRVLIGYFPYLTNKVYETDKLSEDERDRELTAPYLTMPTFLRALAPMLELRPLIEKEIILVSPRADESLRRPFDRAYQQMSRLLADELNISRHLERSQVLSIMSDTYDKEPAYRTVTTKRLTQSLARDFAHEVLSCELVGANYVADSDDTWLLLRAYLSCTGQATGQTAEIDLFLGTLLHDVVLPNIEAINIKDLITLRLNDHEFEEWHLAVRSVLRHFAGATSIPANFANEFRAIADELLLPRARQLRESVKRRRSLARAAKDSSIRFSLSTLGALFGGAALDLWEPAVVSAVSSSALVELWNIARTRRPQSSVLLRHYSLLTSVRSL